MSLVEKHSRGVVDHGPQFSSLIKDATQKRLGGHSSLMAKQMSGQAEMSSLAHDRKTESQPLTSAKKVNNYLNGPKKNRGQMVEDLPSDISEDEWGEIQKFGQKLHEEQMRKQKE